VSKGTSFDSGSTAVNIFQAVIKAYTVIINSHPVVACNPAPLAERMVEQFAMQRGDTVVPSSAASANALGLTPSARSIGHPDAAGS
jgi:hypothetical protein